VNALTSRERVRTAMRLGRPDRVPVMCQLALGHYFLYSGIEAIDVWYTSEGFAEALVRLQRRYRFDGLLINLPGRDPDWRKSVRKIERRGAEQIIHFSSGKFTILPGDDLPHTFIAEDKRWFPSFAETDPAKLFYAEPHGVEGLELLGEFPPWQFDTVRRVRQRAGEVSIHGELFSPFSQFLEMLDFENGLIALLDDPGKVKACLDALSTGAITLGRGLAAAGVDAILISSAFAGAGFLSRQHYETFVLPYERRVIEGIKQQYDIPIYTHTCGAIGDRLDLIAETGSNGIDTLDPPPLGTVELAEAKRQTAGKVFLKGNLDPVNELLLATPQTARAAVRRCLRDGAPGGGYILSSACSVAPRTPPENLMVLAEEADQKEARA
jgi:hypothetical protein